jgi:hypothetical protein
LYQIQVAFFLNSEVDAEVIGCGILTCMAIVTPLILLRDNAAWSLNIQYFSSLLGIFSNWIRIDLIRIPDPAFLLNPDPNPQSH